MYLNDILNMCPSGAALKTRLLLRPAFLFLGVVTLALSVGVTFGQESEAPAKTEKKSAPLRSPFQEDEDLMALERAREEARIKAAKEEAAAAELKEETRKVALRAAMAPIKVLARGLQGERAVVLLAVDSNRRIMLAKDEIMVLTTPAGAVEMRLRHVTRQTLSFELSDGTILPLQ